MKLEAAKRKFKNQWIAFKYTNEAKEEGQILAHAKSQKAVFRKFELDKSGKVFVAFTGNPLPKNCSILFNHSDLIR